MPRPRPPFLQRHKSRHGNPVWYFQRGNGPLRRIRGEYGTDDFQASYEAALRGEAVKPSATVGRSGSLQWLYDRYRESAAWTKEISPATRRQRENIFMHVMEKGGPEPFAAITRANIEESKGKRSDTPAQARNFLDAMRGLFRWAKLNGHLNVDPTEGVKNPKRDRRGDGFPPWTEANVEAYEKKWSLGTKERVWLDTVLYTGLRRGDAVSLGRQHVRDGIATIKTEKTGTEVSIPILPILAKTLKAGPCGDLAFICGDRGRPFTKESFGNAFSAAARAAGVNKSLHGLRKLGATRAANNGATVAELEALFGWEGGAMAALYTKKADRRRLSKGAGSKLARPEAEVIPVPEKALSDQ